VDQFSGYLDTQGNLLRENMQLREQQTVYATQLLELQILQTENAQLRKLLEVSQHADYPMQMAEIVYVERDIFSAKFLWTKVRRKM